ncbi:MAG: hypothetical protein AAF170_08865 [Bacteroidota bacterium]
MPYVRFLMLSVTLVLAACDSETPNTITFDGVEVETRGGAELVTDNGELVVSNIQSSGTDGFFIPGTPSSVDVRTEPLPLTNGQGFGISVIGLDGDELVGLRNRNRGASSGPFNFEITFADALDVKAVRVVYLLDGRVQLEIPSLPFSNSLGRRATDSVGEGEGDTDSAHVVRRGGKYVVVSDSEGDGEPRRAGATGPSPCEGFTIVPPVEISTLTICADRVEVEPLDVTFPDEVAGVAVTGRALGSFRVRSLAAR